MKGIQVPIGGDTAGIHAATAEITAAFRDMAKQIQSALAPAKALSRDMRGSMQATATGTRQAVGTLKGMMNAASNVGFAIHNIASGAKGIRSAFRFLSSLPDGWRRVAKAAMVAGAAMLGVVAAVRVVRASLRGLLNVASSVWSGLRAGAAGAARSIKGVFSGIASAVPGGGMVGSIAGVAGIAGSIALLFTSIKSGLGLAGELERTGIALEALTGSGANAKVVLDEMRATWLSTGVAIEDQAPTIQKFLALGFSQGNALKLQKNILDVAGAVGMTTSEAALLGSALAQVQSKGTVSMEELRQQIAEKGVPVIAALADKLGVTEAALIDMVENGEVKAKALIDVFLNMEGSFGKFVGGSTRMGASFLGMLSRLKGAWSLMLADFAAPIAGSLKPLIASAMNMVDTFRTKAAAAGKAVGDALIYSFALISSGKTFQLIGASLSAAFEMALNTLSRGFTAISQVFPKMMEMLRMSGLTGALESLFVGIAKKFVGTILEGLSKVKGMGDLANDAKRLKAEGGAELYFAKREFGALDFSMLEELPELLKDAFDNAKGAFGTEAVEAMKKLAEEMRDKVRKYREDTAIPPANQGNASAGASAGASEGADGKKTKGESLLTLATSMARVGGGGFGMTFSPMISEQKRTNNLLSQVVKNTRTSGRMPVLV